MNLMDLSTRQWWKPALDATAPGLAAKLPSIVPASAVVGHLSDYWQLRYGFPPALVVAWSGDNPCSLIGVGLVREGRLAISLGTSDTVFGLMTRPTVDAGGVGHVFGAPTGDFMGLTCFSNGSLARERVRDEYGMTWPEFSNALAMTPPGNDGRVMLPWFEPEITPAVARPGVRRFALSPDDAPGNVRAVVEAQQLSMALHSRWMGVRVDTIHATGGAAANREILHVMADVFGAEVRQFEIANSAALGAALRALHAVQLDRGRPLEWEAIVSAFVHPNDTEPIAPDPRNHEVYRALTSVYQACERKALST
jgi:xylulokinase